MHCSRVSWIGAFLALALVSPARGDSVVTPKGEKSAAQQKKDKYECHRWATQHTGFDPKDATSSEPPPQKDPRLDAERGARAGGQLNEARRHEDTIARKKQRDVDDADLERRRASYDRALKTCLEGRNYSVR
jgi:hypothetical protein